MFTLKLYRNGPIPGSGRSVIMECAGVWIDHCPDEVKYVQAFRKTVGVMDEDGPNDFYVGGNWIPPKAEPQITPQQIPMNAISIDNYYSWGVLENAQGKTTEMIR